MTNKFIQQDLDAEKAIAERIPLAEQQNLSKIYTSYAIAELNECKEYIQTSQQESKTMFISYEYSIDTLIANLYILENQTLHQLLNGLHNLELAYNLPVQCGYPLLETYKYVCDKYLHQSVSSDPSFEYYPESFKMIDAFVEKMMLGELSQEL